MRDVYDASQSSTTSPDLAQSLLDGLKSLPQSMDISPIDSVGMMTKDSFPSFSSGDRTASNTSADQSKTVINDKGVIPEQLDTSKPQAPHAVLQHLQKVANHFENYANKLLNAVTPQSKEQGASTDGSGADNLSNSKCPFVRIASRVGYNFNGGGSDQSKTESKSGTTGAADTAQSQRAEAGGAPSSAVEAAKNGATAEECPYK